MKLALILAAAGVLVSGNPASAQLTTWEEDMKQAKALEDRHDLKRAEIRYSNALENFSDDSTQVLTGAIPTCRCKEAKRCVDTLRSLLRVLYAENKLRSAIPVCKALVSYVERTSTGPNDSTLRESKANYKKLIQRVETPNRWTILEPMFKRYQFVGMDRTRVHGILGTPGSAARASGGLASAEVHVGGAFVSAGTWQIGDNPVDDLPGSGIRDSYVLSALMSDEEVADGTRGNTQAIAAGTDVWSWLDIDYVDNKVVKYRLRTRDQMGRWESNNRSPRLPE